MSACHHSWPRSHGQKRCRRACCGRQCRRRRGRRRGRCRGAAAASARREHYESEQQQNCQPFHRPLSGGACEAVELPDEIEFTVEDQLGRLRVLVQTRRLVGWAPKSPPVRSGPDYGDFPIPGRERWRPRSAIEGEDASVVRNMAALAANVNTDDALLVFDRGSELGQRLNVVTA